MKRVLVKVMPNSIQQPLNVNVQMIHILTRLPVSHVPSRQNKMLIMCRSVYAGQI